MSAKSVSKLIPVSKAHPCPVCQGDHKCSTSADGLILCGRKDGPQDGFKHIGPCADPTWTMYRVKGDRRMNATFPDPRTVSAPDFARSAERFAACLPDDRRKQLAGLLRLPEAAMALVPHLGWDNGQGGWTFPEYDGRGEVIGISLRLPDGTKRCVSGSRRGLFLPGGWASNPGPIFVVEGMSDALSLAWCGLAAVGRPGAKAGVELLADLLRPLPADRPVIVLTENDRKPDGGWPGKEGAEFTADKLRKLLKGRRVLIAAPPDGCKDARDWVTMRLADVTTRHPSAGEWDEGEPTPTERLAEVAQEVGFDIARTLSRAAEKMPEKAPPRPLAPFPVPLPISHLGSTDGGVGWVWDGYLARGRITLLGALPKCGKTTLLTHLLKALEAGGTFCGRALTPGSAVVVTEESPDEWAARRNALNLSDAVRVLPRPFFGKPSYEEWLGFLTHLIACLDQQPADVVILDTLADLWPAKDENSAVEVHAALQPLRKLADGRAVVCVHHLRKSDGGEGTAARGSGALVGFVDVIAELRRAPKATDPHGRRRVLKGYGRMTGIPDEWLIELTEDGSGFTHIDPDAAAADTREQQEEGRKDDLRTAILAVLPHDDPDGMTREEIWEQLPPAVRKNDKRFRQVLDDATGQLWRREGSGGKGGAFRYWRNEIVTHPGEEEGGEE